jgi:hypothetical protein
MKKLLVIIPSAPRRHEETALIHSGAPNSRSKRLRLPGFRAAFKRHNFIKRVLMWGRGIITKLLLLFFFIFYSFNAFSKEICKSKVQTYFLKEIYKITLCRLEEVTYEKIFTSRFSIELEYRVGVSRDFLTKSSVDGIEKHYALTEEEKEVYRARLYNIFPPVSKGDSIKLYYDPKFGIKFYHNNDFIGESLDPVFSKRVGDIWINPRTQFKDTRNFLFSE